MSEVGMDFRIRDVRVEDAAALSGLLRSLGWFKQLTLEDADATTARTAHYLESLCSAGESHTVLVVETAGSGIVGYAAVHWLPYLFLTGREGFLSQLFVDESHRGAGAGTLLLDAIVEQARGRGCSRLNVLTRASRDAYQRGFYTSRGWIERDDMRNMVYEL
jgi:GNAT superfamily N-acetyltransferase